MPNANCGSADDFSAVQHRGDHVALDGPHFLKITIDIFVSHSLFFPLQSAEASTQLIVLFPHKAKFFLQWVPLNLCIEGCLPKVFSHLDRTSNSNRIDAKFEQALKQVIDGDILFSRRQNWSSSDVDKGGQ